jgi:hypothetical protein
MDFIEGLPTSNGKNVILVVVDSFTKYAHFISLSHPYTIRQVAQPCVDHVYKLHGLPSFIVSDRDRIFTSALWQELLKATNIKLNISTSYHPQTDGQTEKVNQCLEVYLRCMTFENPKKWNQYLSLAELWYNTGYHTALEQTPFQALYGFPPPQVTEAILPGYVSEEARGILQDRQHATQIIRESLLKAKDRMRKYANRRRKEREFQEGDMVYLRIQPYRNTSLSLHRTLKLHSKYYGPYRVLKRIGEVAYRLLLPPGTQLHPVFHVSQLKKHIGAKVVPSPNLPLVDDEGNIRVAPELILARRVIPRNNEPMAQWQIKWVNLPEEAASWEDANFIQAVFPQFHSRGIE